jgi:DNA-binding MarR family transcriptional regulator
VTALRNAASGPSTCAKAADITLRRNMVQTTSLTLASFGGIQTLAASVITQLSGIVGHCRRNDVKAAAGLSNWIRLQLQPCFGASRRLIYVKMVDMVDMGDIDDAPLGFLLYRVVAVLRTEVSAVLRPVALTLPEFVCLRIISLSPGLSSAELSRHTNVTPQAMNTVLRRLEEIGAVERPESVSSGRALPATLTGQGRALLKRAEGAVRVADGRILDKLSGAQQREFKRMLAKLGSD